MEKEEISLKENSQLGTVMINGTRPVLSFSTLYATLVMQHNHTHDIFDGEYILYNIL
jgi:hypothetical protein